MRRGHRSNLWRWNLGLGRAARSLGGAVTARKLLDASCRIDKFLFAGEKGMASGANADFNVPARRTGMVNGAAGARNGGFGVVGMNICFHNWKKDVKVTPP